MKNSILSTFRGLLGKADQWFQQTPERALDEAYEAAVRIKAIEEQYFGGDRISKNYGTYGASTNAYFQAELRKYLNIMKVRLAVFQTSNTVLRLTPRSITEVQLGKATDDDYQVNVIDKPALILRKLRLVDDVLSRYGENSAETAKLLIVADAAQQPGALAQKPQSLLDAATPKPLSQRSRAEAAMENMESFADKTGVLPRSILKTADRIKRDLDPNAEQEVVETFRASRARTTVALRFVLLLIILPLLTQQVTKTFLVGPIVDRVRTMERVGAFLNMDMEQEAFQELRRYEDILRFEQLIGRAPPLNEVEMQQNFQARAAELREEYHQRSNNAVKNVFADIFATIVFGLVLFNSRREIEILKSFIDEVVYGLSDSAKAFVIILFTDIFVGFHSPHGWEILLEGIGRHFGLAADRDFIFLFIATFPVILDTIFKYWIFRYLNRISPSAVATYRNMNE
ncbi:proton extrusion protein PcxA [Leptolyngbya sp. AN02str]|uniref:proton extrusion protein PcxA n=1 Tax=Leptolyngbya sp. AN02str TaxID=3423363 RepID=UPI003D322FD4